MPKLANDTPHEWLRAPDEMVLGIADDCYLGGNPSQIVVSINNAFFSNSKKRLQIKGCIFPGHSTVVVTMAAPTLSPIAIICICSIYLCYWASVDGDLS